MLITRFIEHGVADTSALLRMPMSFDVERGLPGLAKLAVSAVALCFLLIAGGAVLLRRRFRRRFPG